MADYAIHDTTLTAISNTIRKKDGTFALIDPADYADRINLMGMLDVKNASGYVAHIEDGADDVPLESCVVKVNLSYLRFISVVVTGKNRFNASATNTEQGYIRGSYLTNAGVEYENVNYNISEYIRVDEGKDYTLSGATGNAPSICVYDSSFNFVNGYRYSNASPKTITIDATGCYVRFSYRENEKAGVQFEAGQTGTTFEAYSENVYEAELPSTVTGGEYDIVKGTGIDESQNPVVFTPIPINSVLGINNIYAKRGAGDAHPYYDNGFSNLDVDVDYRSSGTITPVVPTLISKTITENGTYDPEDDDADGYSEVVVNVPQGSDIPSGDHDDPLDVASDYSRLNIQNLYSCLYIDDGELENEIVFQLNTGTGYEGFCVNLSKYNLEEGKTYEMTFELYMPSTVTFSGSYPFGIKHSSTRIPASGSASSNTFNITPSVNFAEQTGSQNVSMTFEASSSNYLVVLLSRIAASRTEWMYMRKFEIEEVTQPLLNMNISNNLNTLEESQIESEYLDNEEQGEEI